MCLCSFKMFESNNIFCISCLQEEIMSQWNEMGHQAFRSCLTDLLVKIIAPNVTGFACKCQQRNVKLRKQYPDLNHCLCSVHGLTGGCSDDSIILMENIVKWHCVLGSHICFSVASVKSTYVLCPSPNLGWPEAMGTPQKLGLQAFENGPHWKETDFSGLCNNVQHSIFVDNFSKIITNV